MHDQQGLFCKTAILRKIAKFAATKKILRAETGADWASHWSLRPARWCTGVAEGHGWADRRWALLDRTRGCGGRYQRATTRIELRCSSGSRAATTQASKAGERQRDAEGASQRRGPAGTGETAGARGRRSLARIQGGNVYLLARSAVARQRSQAESETEGVGGGETPGRRGLTTPAKSRGKKTVAWTPDAQLSGSPGVLGRRLLAMALGQDSR